jgi:hypothetical protein
LEISILELGMQTPFLQLVECSKDTSTMRSEKSLEVVTTLTLSSVPQLKLFNLPLSIGSLSKQLDTCRHSLHGCQGHPKGDCNDDLGVERRSKTR